MKSNSIPIGLTLLAIGLCAGAGDDKTAEKPRSDSEALKGQWLMKRSTRSGNDMANEAGRVRYFFDTMAYIKSINYAVTTEGEFRIDSSKTPKTIDLITSSVEPVVCWHGIYELEGDTLRIAFTADPGQRPTAFAEKGATNAILFVLKRIPD